jgi:hypothetical protein
MTKLSRVLVLALLPACASNVDRTNPFDPQGTGVLKPGRIGGSVVVGGLPDVAGLSVQITDAAGVRVDGNSLVTAADGSFLSPEIAPATYAVEVVVPLGNTPARWTEVKVLPGQTTQLAVITSLPEPGTGFISGRVEMAQTTLSPENVRVVAVRTGRSVRDTYTTYTAPNGSYDFSELPPGNYEVRADRTGFTPDMVLTTLQSPTRDLANPAVMRLYPASAVLSFQVDTGVAQVLGAPFTRDRNVNLLLLAFGASSGLSFEMRFSESPELVIVDPTEGVVGDDVPWRQHLAKVPITLSTGEGGKTVYAQFRLVDAQGIEHLRTEVYSTSIVYDVTPPAVLSLVVAPDATVTAAGRFVSGDPAAVPVQVSATDALSRITGYRLIVGGASPSSVPYVTVASSEATVTIADLVSLSSTDGNKTVGLQLVDGAGNESAVVSRTVIVDHTKPVVTVAINGGAAQTSNAAATLTLTASDATSGVADYKVSSGLICAGGTWQPFSGANASGVLTVPFSLDGGDGVTRSVSVQVRDGGGLVSDCATDDIVVDTVGPNSGRVAIRRGAAATLDGYTNDAQVTLDLFALGAVSWQASTDPTTLYYDNVALPITAMSGAQVSADFCLEGGAPGACVSLPPATTAATSVFVRFYDALGNGSELAQGTIVVDNAPPSGGGLVVPAVGTAQVVLGQTYTRSPVLTVTPQVTLETGLQMRLNVDGAFDAEPWVEYAATTSVVLAASSCPAGLCTVQAQYRDRAGNISGTVEAKVVLDTVAPVAPKVVRATDLVTSTSYTLQIVPGIVVDDNFLRFEVSGGASYPTFTPVAGAMSQTSFPVTLKPNEINTVRIRAVDKAGNISGDDFVLVTHDDTPPAKPSGVTLEAYSNTLRLRWSASLSADVAYYRVYYGTVSKLYNGSGADQGVSPINIGLNTTVSLTGLPNGNRYFVTVSAVDLAGNESSLSSELSGTPSVIAPRLLSQVGGPITGVWENPDPAANYVYVPIDGGLAVTAKDGKLVDFLPALPDVTQVEFAPGLVFVHSSDPALGPVKNVTVQALFATLPNKDAPVRTLSIYSVDPVGGKHTWQRIQPLPDGTAFFLIATGPGPEILGVSATLGIEVPEGDVQVVNFYSSRLTYWTINLATSAMTTREVTIDPVIGWTILRGRYLVLGEFKAGAYTPFELFAQGTSLHVIDPFAVIDPLHPELRGVEVGSVHLNMADDGLVLPFGSMNRAGDVVLIAFSGGDKDLVDALTMVDFSTPTAPVAWGRYALCNPGTNGTEACANNPGWGAKRFNTSLSATAVSGTASSVAINVADFGPNGAFLQSPALVGHHLTFDGNTCGPRVIDTYTAVGSTFVFIFKVPFSGGCFGGGRDAVQAGDTLTAELDSTPDRPGILLGQEVTLVSADPTGPSFLATWSPTPGGTATRVGEAGFTLTPQLSPYDMLHPVMGGTYDAPSVPLRLRVTSDAVLIAKSTELEIRPRAGWDTATPHTVPVDVDFHELHVTDGFVFTAVQTANGGSRIATIDVSNPALPKTVDRMNTALPVKKLTGEGNRLYALQGACNQGDIMQTAGCSCAFDCGYNNDTRCRTTNCWGNQNCNCDGSGALVTYTLATQDRSGTGPFPGASPMNPSLVDTVSVGRAYVDDVVPFWDQLLMVSHGVGVTSGTVIRASGQQAFRPGTELVTSAAFPATANESFGIAVAGNYVFVPQARSAGSNEGDIAAFQLVNGSVAPTLVSTLDLTTTYHWDICRHLEVVGSHLYAFTNRGLVIYDVSGVLEGAAGTKNIKLAGAWGGGGATTIGGTVAGAYAYVMTRQDQGLVIVDVSDPAYPVEAYRLEVRPMDVRIERGLLYVTTQDSGLRIYELARPSAFRVGTRYPDGNLMIQAVTRGRDRIFGALYNQGNYQLVAWDVTTPDRQTTTPPYVSAFAPNTFVPSIPNNFVHAFSDQDVWMQGDSCGGGVPCTNAVTTLDMSALKDGVINTRQKRLPLTYANAGGGNPCTSNQDCACGYEFCDTWNTHTCLGSRLDMADLTRGTATDTFALVRPGNLNNSPPGPNSGIYVFQHLGLDVAAQLQTTGVRNSVLAGSGTGCSPADAGIAALSTVVFSHGVLYTGGLGVVAMPASNPSAADYLDWATYLPAKVDGPDHSMCARGLSAVGRYLYVLGDQIGSFIQTCYPWSMGGSGIAHSGTHLWIYDISDPLHPSFVSELDFNHYQMQQAVVSGNTVYLADSNLQRVVLVDVSNRKKPAIAGAFAMPGQYWRGIDIYATDLFVVDNYTGFSAIDGR